VVVKRKDQEWELIDGQQRLTTLFLILQYLKNAGLKATGAAYSMRYSTREGSAAYSLRDPFSSNQAAMVVYAWLMWKKSMLDLM